METIDDSSFHKNLANYYTSKPLYLDEPTQKKPNTRKLVEQPWQQTKAELWNDVTNTLCNLDFIQAKAASKMIYALLNDFNYLLTLIPDNEKNIIQIKKKKCDLNKFSKDLILYAKRQTQILNSPKTIIPLSVIQINTEINRQLTIPGILDRLNDFYKFISLELVNFQLYACNIQNFVHQQAWNYSSKGPVSNISELMSNSLRLKLLTRKEGNRPNWNPFNPKIKIFSYDNMPVVAVSITPDGGVGVSGYNDGSFVVWNLDTGEMLNRIQGYQLRINYIYITPDIEKVLVCYDNLTDGYAVLWDLKSATVLHVMSEDAYRVVITPDWTKAFRGTCRYMYGNCYLEDMENDKILRTFKWHWHSKVVLSVDMNSNYTRAISMTQFKGCIVWDLENGKELYSVDGECLNGGVCITPDGKIAIVVKSYNSFLWNLENGKIENKYRIGSSYKPSITPDGAKAIIGSYLIDTKTGELLYEFENSKEIALSADGSVAFSYSDNKCTLWNLEYIYSNKSSNENYINEIQFLNKSNHVVIGLNDGKVIVTNYCNEVILWCNQDNSYPVKSLSITPDEKFVLSRNGSSNNANHSQWMLWEIESGRKFRDFSDWDNHWVKVASATPDCNRIFCGTTMKCLLWDIKKNELVIELRGGHLSEVMSVLVCYDGTKAISVGDFSILWDLKTGQLLSKIKRLNSCLFTPDDKIVIGRDDDKSCLFWEIKTGNIVKNISFKFSSSGFHKITFDGKNIISTNNDNCIFWSLKTEKIIWELPGDFGIINDIILIPGSNKIILKTLNDNIVLWDLETGKVKTLCAIPYKIKSIFFSYSLLQIIGVNYSAEIFILNFSKELLNFIHYGILTIQSIWNFELGKYMELSANCPFCGHQFAPSESVLATIEEITKKAGLKPEQSPCLELPDEAWEEPGLLSNCPNCGEALKFNPFIAGDYKPKPKWKFWKR